MLRSMYGCALQYFAGYVFSLAVALLQLHGGTWFLASLTSYSLCILFALLRDWSRLRHMLCWNRFTSNSLLGNVTREGTNHKRSEEGLVMFCVLLCRSSFRNPFFSFDSSASFLRVWQVLVFFVSPKEVLVRNSMQRRQRLHCLKNCRHRTRFMETQLLREKVASDRCVVVLLSWALACSM